MSPRLGAITARNPLAARAHTAASREGPQPKVSAATTKPESRYGGWSRLSSACPEPAALNRTSWNRKLAYSGTSLSRRRKRAGMIRSVSTFGRLIGIATAGTRGKGCISGAERPHGGEAPGDGGRRGHRRGHEMRAGGLPLAALEVPVGG